MLKALIESIRLKQWSKNLLVFGALVFVPGALQSSEMVLRAVLAFFIFSLAASAGYLVNDIRDREYDVTHPKKCRRPIASGRLSVGFAITAAIVLAAVAVTGGLFLDLAPVKLPESAIPLNGFAFPFLSTMIGYLLLTLVYSIWLRNVTLLDVMVLSGGFALRAVAGAVALKVIVSPWLLLCSGLLALYLALGKRRQELVRLAAVNTVDSDEVETTGRRSLSGYSIPLLDQLLTVAASVNVMSYSLYTFLHSASSDNRLMLTIPFVVYGVFRYQLLIYNQHAGEAPSEVLLNDRPLAICILLWVLAVAILLWPGLI